MSPKRPREEDEDLGDVCEHDCDTASNVLTLNVGGRRFQTQLDTLVTVDYFRALCAFSDHFHGRAASHNEFFVDRCPRLFEIILCPAAVHTNFPTAICRKLFDTKFCSIYLRFPRLNPPHEPEKVNERHVRQALRTLERPQPRLTQDFGERLIDECRFFGIDWLMGDLAEYTLGTRIPGFSLYQVAGGTYPGHFGNGLIQQQRRQVFAQRTRHDVDCGTFVERYAQVFREASVLKWSL